MTAFVSEVVNRFLARNGFSSRPEAMSSGSQHHVGSPRKRARRELSQKTTPSTNTPSTRPQTPMPGKSSGPLHRDSPAAEELALIQDDSGYFEWVDPSSGESFLVDSNTGNSFPSNRIPNHLRPEKSATLNNDSLEDPKASYVDRRWLKSGTSRTANSRDALGDTRTTVPEWLTKALQVSGLVIEEHGSAHNW